MVGAACRWGVRYVGNDGRVSSFAGKRKEGRLYCPPSDDQNLEN